MFIANEGCAVSSPWQIHSGAGIGKYTFIRAMAENNVNALPLIDQRPLAH